MDEIKSKCGECDQITDTTHVHYRTGGSAYANYDCPFGGRAYEPGVCSGDDYCDECLEKLGIEIN